jgi:hypothetical protein
MDIEYDPDEANDIIIDLTENPEQVVFYNANEDTAEGDVNI